VASALLDRLDRMLRKDEKELGRKTRRPPGAIEQVLA
jgi:hypothetical protein